MVAPSHAQTRKKPEQLFWPSGGGYDRNVIKPSALTDMIDYIHMNHFRRGLAEKLEEWKWWGATWYLNGGELPIVSDPSHAARPPPPLVLLHKHGWRRFNGDFRHVGPRRQIDQRHNQLPDVVGLQDCCLV